MTEPAADRLASRVTSFGGRVRAGLGAVFISPDLRSTRSMTWLALGVWLATCGLLIARAGVLRSYGDTDDAMRLVIVRALVDGRGWYDQAIPRLGHGAWLHWSRLLDGGIAGMMIGLRQFLPAAQAEYWTRYVWPLLWVLPAVAAALAIARNWGGRLAPVLTAILLLIISQLFRQFIPGRIDHHDIQITMTVVALACALAQRNRTRWAVGGGAAAALGLAIGLEALIFQALIGASYGLDLMRDRKTAAPAAAYGLTLAAVASALFLAETPPWRWSMPFCDSLAPNLVGGLVVAGAGLALAAWAAGRAPAWARIALVVLAAMAAGGTYLALDPQCLHGPFAAMNPAVRPFWFNRIQEVQPLPVMFRLEPKAAWVASSAMIMALAAAAVLTLRQWRAPGTPALLAAALLVAACAVAWSVWRMQDYVFWIGIPALGAALSWLSARYLRNLVVPAAAITAALSPIVLGTAGFDIARINAKPGRRYINAGPRCFAPAGYRALAALPSGMVLAPTDLGPFILAFTRQSVVDAPYHRVSDQILAAHLAYAAPPAKAEARVRALGATLIVDCPPYPLEAPAGGFGGSLRRGPPPPWLKVVSKPGAVLKIYQVLPPNAPGPAKSEGAIRGRRG